MHYHLKWALHARSTMEEITVSDSIPDSMHFLHEVNNIAHWQQDDERQGRHPCSRHPVEIGGNVSSQRHGPEGPVPHWLEHHAWELSVSKRAKRLKHINIHQQTLNDTCQKDKQSKTQKKSKAKKSFFLPFPSQLQQKFPPSHCFIIWIFFEKV